MVVGDKVRAGEGGGQQVGQCEAHRQGQAVNFAALQKIFLDTMQPAYCFRMKNFILSRIIYGICIGLSTVSLLSVSTIHLPKPSASSVER